MSPGFRVNFLSILDGAMLVGKCNYTPYVNMTEDEVYLYKHILIPCLKVILLFLTSVVRVRVIHDPHWVNGVGNPAEIGIQTHH